MSNSLRVRVRAALTAAGHVAYDCRGGTPQPRFVIAADRRGITVSVAAKASPAYRAAKLAEYMAALKRAGLDVEDRDGRLYVPQPRPRRRGRPTRQFTDAEEVVIRRQYCIERRSIEETAAELGCNRETLRQAMPGLGIEVSRADRAALRTARTAAATPRVAIERTRRALAVLGDQVPEPWAQAAGLLIANPGESLAGLAVHAGVSKDVIAGRLRRLLAAAENEMRR